MQRMMRWGEDIDLRFELNDAEMEWLHRFTLYADNAMAVSTRQEAKGTLADMPLLAQHAFREAYTATYGYAIPCNEWIQGMVDLDLPVRWGPGAAT